MVTVRVNITLKPSLLDSAGRTVAKSLRDLEFGEVGGARIGKTVTLELERYDESRVRAMCERLLANPVIEDYSIEVVP
ncbi:MAG: phosphoribosylformylglycinamidine synthase subunit PurS [Armatimonadetes bacterium]|nr:phosphoribosylformylglycinamidine synthase subunit PurS [Armatimonadota bacterium]MBS1710709.1 phosphoribosylformylglycinamidine synthase subunit PurS [Armatimonadota bacterium]MBX3108380.1 phosphoribosylformylglycinamidine synthase subunit PurS [Fimbriimonadaceae bacterium]